MGTMSETYSHILDVDIGPDIVHANSFKLSTVILVLLKIEIKLMRIHV